MQKSENQSDWKLNWTKPAQKFLLSLSETDRIRITSKIEEIILVNPYTGKQINPKHKKLYRKKSGNYVIIYRINNDEKLVSIVIITPRQNAYKFK